MDEKEKKEQEERAVKAIMEEAEKGEAWDKENMSWASLILLMIFSGVIPYGYNPTPMSEKEQIAFLKGKVEAYEKELG